MKITCVADSGLHLAGLSTRPHDVSITCFPARHHLVINKHISRSLNFDKRISNTYLIILCLLSGPIPDVSV